MKQKHLINFIERAFLLIAITMILCGFINKNLSCILLAWTCLLCVLILDIILIIKKQNSKHDDYKNNYNFNKFIKIWIILMITRNIIIFLIVAVGTYIAFSNLLHSQKIILNTYLGIIISITINFFDAIIIKYKRKLLPESIKSSLKNKRRIIISIISVLLMFIFQFAVKDYIHNDMYTYNKYKIFNINL